MKGQKTGAIALVRSKQSQQLCQAQGVTTHCVDLDDGNLVLPELPASHRLIYLVPPPKQGVCDLRLQNFLGQLNVIPGRVVLISTTGVYGDSAGAWIDEDAPLDPSTDRGRRRLHAERLLVDWCGRHSVDFVILRVPGIYAADRLPLARLIRQLPMPFTDQSPYTNRIHADDLARICIHATHAADVNQVINVTDGSPCRMTEYFNRVADSCGLPRPPQISTAEAMRELSPGMQSYLSESRRISNQRLLRWYGQELEYPNLETLLQQLHNRQTGNP